MSGCLEGKHSYYLMSRSILVKSFFEWSGYMDELFDFWRALVLSPTVEWVISPSVIVGRLRECQS